MSEPLYRKCETCKGMRIAFEYETGPNATHSERCRTCDGWGFVPVEVQGDGPGVRIEMPGSLRSVALSIGDYQLTYDHSAQQWVFVGKDWKVTR